MDLALLSLAVTFGLALGAVRFRGMRLGISAVLFSSLLFGQTGLSIDHTVLRFLRDFALIIFIYSLGLQVGPGFLTSLRDEGLRLNILSVVGAGVGRADDGRRGQNIPFATRVICREYIPAPLPRRRVLPRARTPCDRKWTTDLRRRFGHHMAALRVFCQLPVWRRRADPCDRGDQAAVSDQHRRGEKEPCCRRRGSEAADRADRF